MIYNGNYDYSTYDKIKDDLIEAFVRYYGEKYRESITEKVNKMKYSPYHPLEYLIEYHNKFIKEFRSDILNTFFRKIGVRKTDARMDAVWEKDQDLSKINILNSNYGGMDFRSSDFDDNNDLSSQLGVILKQLSETDDIKSFFIFSEFSSSSAIMPIARFLTDVSSGAAAAESAFAFLSISAVLIIGFLPFVIKILCLPFCPLLYRKAR